MFLLFVFIVEHNIQGLLTQAIVQKQQNIHV